MAFWYSGSGSLLCTRLPSTRCLRHYGDTFLSERVSEITATYSSMSFFYFHVNNNHVIIKRSDKVTNEDSLQFVEEDRVKEDKVNKVKERKQKWIGHVLRHNGMFRDVIDGILM